MGLPTVLLLIPPLTQLNTPYPSTAYLTGFLRSKGIRCEQADLGIEMVLRLFSREGLNQVFDELQSRKSLLHPEAHRMLANRAAILDHIDPIVAYLQGKAPSLTAHWRGAGLCPKDHDFALGSRCLGTPRPRTRPSRRRHCFSKTLPIWFRRRLRPTLRSVVTQNTLHDPPRHSTGCWLRSRRRRV